MTTTGENLAPTGIDSLIVRGIVAPEIAKERTEVLGAIRKALGRRSTDELSRILAFIEAETVATGDLPNNA